MSRKVFAFNIYDKVFTEIEFLKNIKFYISKNIITLLYIQFQILSDDEV